MTVPLFQIILLLFHTLTIMPSSQEIDTTFTLSFGGVEFSLTPASGGGGSNDDDDDDDAVATERPAGAAVVSVTKMRDGEVTIDLNGFVGTLRVTRGRDCHVARGARDVVATASAKCPPTMTTEGEPVDGNHDDGDRTTGAAARDDASDAALVVSAATAGPNPVEDTPSPNAKGRAGGGEEEEAEAEVEDEEETAAKKGCRWTTKKKGQQKKLDFFGRRNANKRCRGGVEVGYSRSLRRHFFRSTFDPQLISQPRSDACHYRSPSCGYCQRISTPDGESRRPRESTRRSGGCCRFRR
jgi:hypothetical protein